MTGMQSSCLSCILAQGSWQGAWALQDHEPGDFVLLPGFRQWCLSWQGSPIPEDLATCRLLTWPLRSDAPELTSVFSLAIWLPLGQPALPLVIAWKCK